MPDPTTRLLTSTRRRLMVVTLTLLVLLVVGIGAATAIVGLRALDADVDRALEASVDAAVSHLDGELPQPREGSDPDEEVLASSDTFLLYLDQSGKLIANPSGTTIKGLPDEVAVANARIHGLDLRTVDSNGIPIRLLTEPVTASPDAPPVGYVQGGFVLTLHEQQTASLIQAIVLVGLVGLAGAAVVTLVVTGRALVPIRRTLAAQRRFVADASHELKTPAAIIRANAEVLQREDLVEEDGEPLVADVISETDRLGRLVGDLLQLASADATGLVIERRSVDVAALAADVVRQGQALASQHGVDLRYDPVAAAVGSATVRGDPDRLSQLTLILVDNALDHAPEGTTVRVAVRRTGRRVELTVDDEGPGVPTSDRARVFEPFTRLPGVRRDRAEGTGLGLAIASRIVAAHDGTIAIDDAPGGGARFVVALPAVPDGPASS